ncbi:serine protease, partial [Streptomyces sp. NPDC048845]
MSLLPNTADTAPQPGRVARICAEIPVAKRKGTAKYDFGSGYRISDRLVITAAHVVGVVDVGGPVRVDLGGDGDFRTAECVWKDTVADVALLRFDEPPRTTVAPLRLGRVDRSRSGDVTARAMGHPVHTRYVDRHTGEDVRGRRDVPCVVRTAETGSPGALRIRLDATPASGAPGDSPWQGMSGAAVLTKGTGLL